MKLFPLRHLEMMNHLNDMKIVGDNLVSFHRSMFYAQRLLDGVLNQFAERWWGMKTVSMFTMGYEISLIVRNYPPP